MAWTFPTPCTQPGCRALVRRGGRCARCRIQRSEKARTSSGGLIYDTVRWRAIRARLLAEEPWCRMCRTKGIFTIARQLDHIIPLDAGGDPWPRSNLQPLCDACHGAKTYREKLANR